MAVPDSLDLLDPRWLPLAYSASDDSLRFAFLDPDQVGTAPFLDQRLGEPWTRAIAVSCSDLELQRPSAVPAWLFHTAFCCSTLLARALHSPPQVMALKEPRALLDLAHVSLDPSPAAQQVLARRLPDLVGLLGRPWHPDGKTLIKPTNAVNRLLPRLLAASPGAPAVLLYGSLEDFLLSCVKKLPGAEEPMRWMAGYLLPGTRLEQALSIPSGHRLNFIEACVLTWYAQIEIYASALADDAEDRLRTLDMRLLLAQPEATVRAAATWLQLDSAASDRGLDDRVRDVFSRNSKQSDASYGPDRRAAERAALTARHGDLLRAALSWSEQSIAPQAIQPRNWKPLSVR